jgi:hypothetical protein
MTAVEAGAENVAIYRNLLSAALGVEPVGRPSALAREALT